MTSPSPHSSSDAVFSLKGVGKRFGHHRILENVGFDIQKGEFVLLLGANGAGKSTLLKIMSTLMRPSEGVILFEGKDFGKHGEFVRRSLGVISHESRFYGDLTARENLKVFGTLYGVEQLKTRIEEALEELRLIEFPDVPVRAFSSGMMKRLAFARLALYRPPMLLLDEPYSGLDKESVELLDDFLSNFGNSGGTTVMVTHQFTGGVDLSNRILILHRGALVYNQAEQNVTAAHCAALLDQHSRKTPS